MIEYNNKKYVCFLDIGMDLIRNKWKAVIICHLKDGPKRYLQLKRITEGISHKVLTDTLNKLIEDGIVNKTSYDEVPPRVDIELTDFGKRIIPALDIIEALGEEKFKENQLFS